MPTRLPKTHVGELIDRGLLTTGVRSQNKLAQHCGISSGYIAMLRAGTKHPSPHVIRRIADALGQDVEDYQLAILADRGEVPHWGRVLSYELGFRLQADEEAFILAIIRQWRGM